MDSEGNVSKQEGLRLLKAGQIDEAIAILEKVKEANPDDAEVYSYLGAAYNKKNDRLHAIAAFEQAAQLEETPRSCYNLGLMYETVHRTNEAIRQYRMALKLDPEYAPALEAIERLTKEFAATHPQPAQDPAETAAAATESGAPAAKPEHTPAGQMEQGPPSSDEIQAKKQQELAEQKKNLIKSGIIYGAICGAIVAILAYLAINTFTANILLFTSLPYVLTIIPFFGAIFGSIVGYWVGQNCGSQIEGMKAGAAVGIVFGLVSGFAAGISGVFFIMIFFAIIYGLLGMFIGKLINAGVGWN